MKKYKVIIPPPSAKRMSNHARVTVRYKMFIDLDMDVQHSITQDIYDLEPLTKEFEFEVSDEYEWFSVELKYSNSTGSREEKKALIPIQIS